MTRSSAPSYFSPGTADYPAVAAVRRFPVVLDADGADINAAVRAAYAEGLDAGLNAATP